jgi:hypothetical protein
MTNMTSNYLKAVFWDYPELCDPEAVERRLREARAKNDRETVRWIMARFLERGRFRDAKLFFRPKEVRENLEVLRISNRARKKWKRFLEVYESLD